MIGKFGQIQYSLIEGQINLGNIIEKNVIKKEEVPSLPSNEESSKSELEEIVSKEMKRLSIKYFKGREFKKNDVSKWIEGYFEDMQIFVKNKFPDFKFFLCVVTQGKDKNSSWISNRHISFTNTDGSIQEIYRDKILAYSYLMYIKKKNFSLEISMTDFENYMKPKMKKIINSYLDQRKYEHEEFEDYSKGIQEEIKREICDYSKKICCNIIIIFLKKPTDGYSITWKWLSGNNTHKFIEKYEGQYTKCLGIIGSCIP